MKESINIKSIYEANEEVRGTQDYSKYYMETYNKTNGKWKFSGWSIPYEETATIKTYKDTKYLMTNDDTKYVISEAIAELLGIDEK